MGGAVRGGAAGHEEGHEAWGGSSEIEWGDAPPLVGGEPSRGGDAGEGAATAAAAVVQVPFWFPTAEDGATPGAPVVHARNIPAVGAAARAEEESVTAAVREQQRHRDGVATFSCACGAVRAVSTARVDQLQHCHCRMCRSIHGTPFVTWAPLPEAAVSWEVAGGEGGGALRVAATSAGAVRHGCDRCGTTLSIKYHSQPDTVWLAAGAAAPGYVGGSLGEGMRRVLHISCSWRAAWWPVTGEERRTGIPYAG